MELLGTILRVLIPLATRSSSLSTSMSTASPSAPVPRTTDVERFRQKDPAWVSRLVGSSSGSLRAVDGSTLSPSAHSFMPASSSSTERARSGEWTLLRHTGRRRSDPWLRTCSINENLGLLGLVGASPSSSPGNAEQLSSLPPAAHSTLPSDHLVVRLAADQSQRATHPGDQPTPAPVPAGTGAGFALPRLSQISEFPYLGLPSGRMKSPPPGPSDRRQGPRRPPAGGQEGTVRPVTAGHPPGFPVALHHPLGGRSASFSVLERDEQQPTEGASSRQQKPPGQPGNTPPQPSALTRELHNPVGGQPGGAQRSGQPRGAQGGGGGGGYPTALKHGNG